MTMVMSAATAKAIVEAMAIAMGDGCCHGLRHNRGCGCDHGCGGQVRHPKHETQSQVCGGPYTFVRPLVRSFVCQCFHLCVRSSVRPSSVRPSVCYHSSVRICSYPVRFSSSHGSRFKTQGLVPTKHRGRKRRGMVGGRPRTLRSELRRLPTWPRAQSQQKKRGVGKQHFKKSHQK